MTGAVSQRTVVFVHTVPALVGVFQRLAAELLPGVKVWSMLDEPLLEGVRQRGGLVAEDGVRLAGHVEEAARIGADAVLVTCSTVSPVVDLVTGRANIPVLKIDEAMVAEAIRRGSRIGVLATAATTLEPTRQLLQQEAARHSKDIAVEPQLVEGGRDAFFAGDLATHDRLIHAAAQGLLDRVDIIVLAQATMARARAMFDETQADRVLTSPHLALAALAEVLETGRS